MAITSGRQVIGTTRQIVDGVSPNPSRLHIHNMDNTDAIYIGNESVTTANGFVLFKHDSVELQCYASEHVYVISTKGNHAISFLKQV